MNDRQERLEAELSAMRLRPASPQLAGALSAALREPGGRSASDRGLIFAMGVGALAACVVVGLLIFEAKYVPPAPEKAAVVQAAAKSDHAFALTRASSGWRDRVN